MDGACAQPLRSKCVNIDPIVGGFSIYNSKMLGTVIDIRLRTDNWSSSTHFPRENLIDLWNCVDQDARKWQSKSKSKKFWNRTIEGPGQRTAKSKS